MAALGRVLQIAGWLWFAAGIVGPMVDYDVVNPFPGLILIFVARALRTQAARNAPYEEESEEEAAEPAQPERPLNTDRIQRPAAPPPSPDPVTRYREAEPAPRPEPAYVPEPGPSDEDGETGERENIIERIVIAGRQASTKDSSQDRVDSARSVRSGDTKPMSSAEMIAQARKRWDRKT